MTAIDFVLFVTPIEGKLVARYGTGSYIGCVRQRVEPATEAERKALARKQPWARTSIELKWDTETIVPIPRAEFDRFRKEYTRATAPGGGLHKHTKAAWEQQVKARKEVGLQARKEYEESLTKAQEAPSAETTAG